MGQVIPKDKEIAMMKKRIWIFLVVLLATIILGVVAGSVYNHMKQNTDRSPVVLYLDRKQKTYHSSFLFAEDTAALAVKILPTLPNSVPNFDLLQQTETGKVQVQPVYTLDPKTETWIFEESETAEQRSCFEFHRVGQEDYVFLFITPSFTKDHTETFGSSKHVGFTPTDSLGTEPFRFQEVTCQKGFPTWCFVIPVDQIDEAYQLTYEDHILTGKEILARYQKT